MADPSQSVPPALLPHIHLVSLYRYPLLPQILGLETVVNYLLEAPRITREAAGMSWTFLDAPQDGTVMLVWQPLAQMGTNASSDGYIWADSEQAFSSESKGYTVEMYVHRSGYHPPHEQVAVHSRRRYRLLQSQNSTNSNPVNCDPSLWILHYSRADPQYQFPANRIPPSNQNHSLTQRKYLQQHGQLVRKEFMLYDRNNWPTINLPSGNMPHYGPQIIGYPGNVISHMNRSQQQTYLQQQQQHHQQQHQHQHQHQQQQQHQQHQQQQQQQHQQQQQQKQHQHQHQQHQQQPPVPGNQGNIGPPASKRMRHSNGPNLLQRPSIGIGGVGTGIDGTIEDEEDNSRGDLMDFLTPRDVSTTRYMQHHEWMEEIFNSPYNTGQIVPVELGIGRKGELEDLTKDFFTAPTEATPIKPLPPGSHPPRVGRLEAGKAEDFTTKATEKVAELNAEMERMKRQHAKRMARLNKGATIRLAERSLRSAPMSAADFGLDEWKFGGSARSSANGDAALFIEQKSIDQITADMESLLGKKIKPVKEMECIQNGGLEEKVDTAENDGLEYDLVSPLAKIDNHSNQLTSYAGSQDLLLVDQSHTGSMGHTPQPSLAVTENHGIGSDLPQSNETFLDGDIAMSEMPDPSESKEMETSDWVIVSKEIDSGRSLDEESPSLENLTNMPTPHTGAEAPGGNPDTTSDALANFAPTDSGNTAEDFTTNEFSEAIDFGNLDTAGEALSGYGAEHSSMGLDEHGDLGLDDSAFGAAFHPTQASPAHQSERLGHDG